MQIRKVSSDKLNSYASIIWFRYTGLANKNILTVSACICSPMRIYIIPVSIKEAKLRINSDKKNLMHFGLLLTMFITSQILFLDT
jgi:hypothetical protein